MVCPVKLQLSFKQIATWLAIGFIIYLVWQNTTGVSSEMNTYLRAVFGFLGDFVQKLGQFLSGLFGGGSEPAPPPSTTA